jgi:hypothetical protein
MESGRPAKRSRGGTPLSAQKKGQIASIRFNKLHPWSDYGAARIMRGSDLSLERFGPSYRQANDVQKANRKVTGFTGRGRYNYLTQLGTMAGSAVGGYAANSMGYSRSSGRKYGGMIGGALVRASGYGEYKLRGHNHVSNNLIASTNTLSMMSADAHTGAIVVTRSELVKDITPTASGFESQFTCDINPGLNELNGGCFDWLSQIAQYYEQYEFEQVLFEFKSTVSPGNTSAAGTVIMAPLQVGSSNYEDKNSMSYAQGQASAGVAEHILAGVECHKDQVYGGSVKRTRVGTIDGELINYDLGRFQIATQDATADLNIGELWVHYTVRLSQPRFGSVSSGGTDSSLPIYDVIQTGSTTSSLLASQTNLNIFGLVPVVSQVQDAITNVFDTSTYSGAVHSSSSIYKYYTGTSDTTGTSLANNTGFLRFNSGQNFVNRQVIFTVKLSLGAFTGVASTSGANFNLRIAPFGNASYVADRQGQYVRTQSLFSKITFTSVVQSYAAGIELLFQFCLQFGGDDTVTTGVFLVLEPSAGGVSSAAVLSTALNTNLLITSANDETQWSGFVE